LRILKWLLVAILLPSAAMAALTSAERKSQFEKAMSAIIAAATPTLNAVTREQIVKDFVNAKPNKGQAINLADGRFWRSTDHEDIEVVSERALEGCQLRFGKPCALLAINDEIVAEGALAAKDMPRLHYAGKYEVAQIPIARMVLRRRPDIQNYDKAMEPKSMAIHPTGRLFVAAGEKDALLAQAQALQTCNDDPTRSGRDGPCFVYAVNNDVVIGERRMAPK
jgi:hypothetical protein